MASEMRRAAKALLEMHPHAIKSDYSVEESVARLASALIGGEFGKGLACEVTREGVRIRRAGTRDAKDFFASRWVNDAEGVRLEGEFAPSPALFRLLQLASVSLALLLAATAWAFFRGESPALTTSLVVFSVLSILGFPIVILGLASQREGREATIVRRIRRVLTRPTD